MKTIISILLILNVNYIYSQLPCEYSCLDFEDSICLKTLNIDTLTYPSNIWQVGKPQKSLFDTTTNESTVVVTDTINSYPINNNSVFIYSKVATMGYIYGLNMLYGAYFIQTDSLKDYGNIEVSMDNGTTWIDIINDTIYNAFVWYSPKPVLTGNSNGWQYFDVLLADIGSIFNIELGDTVLYKFSFKSDNISENLGGIMYDDLCFNDFVEGVSKIHFKPIKSSIYPNPSTSIFTIEFENPESEKFELSIYDIHSKLTLKKDNITENKIIIDATAFKSGTYIYKITNLTANKRCWGKFITN